jgi:hypothetical protein
LSSSVWRRKVQESEYITEGGKWHIGLSEVLCTEALTVLLEEEGSDIPLLLSQIAGMPRGLGLFIEPAGIIP